MHMPEVPSGPKSSVLRYYGLPLGQLAERAAQRTPERAGPEWSIGSSPEIVKGLCMQVCSAAFNNNIQ